jgi:Zn-dependent metalloprotease
MRRKIVSLLVAALAINSAAGIPPMRAQDATRSAADQNRPGKRMSREQAQALDSLSAKLTETILDDNAVPTLLSGDLGEAAADPQQAAVETMQRLGQLFRLTEQDELAPKQEAVVDELRQTHVRLQQRHRGLRVVGGEVVVHLAEGRVVGVNGRFVPDINLDRTQPALSAEEAIGLARIDVPGSEVPEPAKPELVVFIRADRTPHLAWSRLYSYLDGEGEKQTDLLFADAQTGELLGRHPQIWPAQYREVYDAQRRDSLPGRRSWKEGDSTGKLDDAEKAAVTNSGKAYSFFKNTFGHDSYDDRGAKIRSTVHFGRDHNNAYWYNARKLFVYGDGDGWNFTYFTKSRDVVAHEFTHAVTSSTADLIYFGESGALNEAVSDIMGECSDTSRDWRLGEDVFTPGIPGDALRYLNDPARDGRSRDFYPDRYTGPLDNGGVHLNSGIANLAFYLMAVGGSHPRGKTSVVVPAIGIEKARMIWFRALTCYMTSTTNFREARALTARVAADRYGAAAANAVQKAWEAVGVPAN